jgi:hypothetical protein
MLDRIRAEAKERAESKEIGGARWQFDMQWLIEQIDKRDAILEQVRLLTDQGIQNGGSPVNVYRLDAALSGEEAINPRVVEYEYNLKPERKGILYTSWCTEKEMVDLWEADSIEDVKPQLPPEWKLIRRIKPGDIEEV